MKNILIVEDDRDMQEVYRIFFDGYKNKYQIDIAGNAEQGLKKVRSNEYDLVILDIIMEPVTGDSFFVYVKNDERTKSIPIIVVSVLDENILGQLKKKKDVEILQKPITKDELIARVQAHIG